MFDAALVNLCSAVAVLALCVYAIVRHRLSVGLVYLPDMFLLALLSHCLGAIWIYMSDPKPASQFVLLIATAAYVSATACSLVLLSVGRPGSAGRARASSLRLGSYGELKLSMLLWAVIALNLSVIFFLLANPSLRQLILASFLLEGSSLLDARKAITASTEGYMAPGIIKLVRDVLSPIFIGTYLIASQRGFRSLVLWMAIIVVGISVLVGGQRYPILALCLVVCASWAHGYMSKSRFVRLGPIVRKLLVVGSLALMAFGFMTTLLGRSSDSSRLVDSMYFVVAGIAERIVYVVPNEAVKTYSVWHASGPTLGGSWWRELKSLVPGRSQSSMASELHAAAGGSAEGNAPLFFAADAWFAFGLPGVIVVPMVFLIGFHLIDRTLARQHFSVSSAMRYFLVAYIPMMYSPFLFLLNGGLLIVPLIVLIEVLRTKRSRPWSAGRQFDQLKNHVST